MLADDGACARVEPSVWRDAAEQIAAAFARGAGTAGLVGSIDSLARALAGPFPYTCTDVNELPDLIDANAGSHS